MPDDTTKRGPPDRRRVSQQPHEVKYLARRTGSTIARAAEVVRTRGPFRKEVVKALPERRTQ